MPDTPREGYSNIKCTACLGCVFGEKYEHSCERKPFSPLNPEIPFTLSPEDIIQIAESAKKVRESAARAGMTPQEFARAFNELNRHKYTCLIQYRNSILNGGVRFAPLPACLMRQNSNRLVSLLDIMNMLEVPRLAEWLQRLATEADRCASTEEDDHAAIYINEVIDGIRQTVSEVKAVCSENGLVDASAEIQLAEPELKYGRNVAALRQIIMRVQDAVAKDLRSLKVLVVANDRTEYVDNPGRFADLRDAFPSAIDDLTSAANCLAVECPTACVFHAMRAAEVSLRALAWDRRIKIPKNRPIEFATWEAIIRELERAETDIMNYPQTPAREAQFAFYHGAMMEFRAFKNRFRNPGMHSRHGFLRGEAESALARVVEFMRILATRIGERKRTPKIWRQP